MTRGEKLLIKELKREMGSTEPLLEEEIERLNKALLDIKEVLKDYGDIVGYSMYNITGEQLINILDIVNKALGSE